MPKTRNPKTFVLRSSLVLLIASMLGGCQNTSIGLDAQNTNVTVSDPKLMTQTGFLSDYARLKINPQLGGMACWYDRHINANKYHSVMISRIVVSIAPPKDGRTGATSENTVDPSDLKMLTDYFHGALTKSLAPVLKVTNKTGPDVLVIRIALTDLMPTAVAGSVAGTLIPYAFVLEASSGSATGLPAGSTPYLGETGMEMQFRDGATGAVVAECRDTEIGRKYAAEMNNGISNAAKTWASGYLNSFQSWSYAKDAFDKWSINIAKRISELKAGEVQK